MPNLRIDLIAGALGIILCIVAVIHVPQVAERLEEVTVKLDLAEKGVKDITTKMDRMEFDVKKKIEATEHQLKRVHMTLDTTDRTVRAVSSKLDPIEKSVTTLLQGNAKVSADIDTFRAKERSKRGSRRRQELWNDPSVAYEACENQTKLVVTNCAAVTEGECEDRITGQCGSLHMNSIRRCAVEADLPRSLHQVAVMTMKCGRSFVGYRSSDAVSTAVFRDGIWGNTAFLFNVVAGVRRDIASVVTALLAQQRVPEDTIQRILAQSDDGVVFVDAGAHVGSMSLQLWSKGVSVIAVEAMPLNQQLLKMARCVNVRGSMSDEGQSRLPPFDILPYALTDAKGAERKDCILVSDQSVGDGIVECGKDRIEDAKKRGYEERGAVRMRTMDQVLLPRLDQLSNGLYSAVVRNLDGQRKLKTKPILNNPVSGAVMPGMDSAQLLEFLRKPKVIVKIDIEGSEAKAWTAAEELLQQHRPIAVWTEMWPSIDVIGYFRLMHDNDFVGHAEKFGWIRTEEDAKKFHAGQKGPRFVAFVRSNGEGLVVNLTQNARK